MTLPAPRRRRSRTGTACTALLAAIALPLLGGCVEPTPYAPAIERDGYASRPIEENRYRVSFAGNSATARETVESYLLYRAAEVTLASGHDWFRVVTRDTETDTRYRTTTSGFFPFYNPFFYRSRHRYGSFGPFGPFGPLTTSTRPVNRYEATAEILVFSGAKPAGDADAYDARSVRNAIGPWLRLPETSG